MNNDIKILNIELRTWYSLTNFEDHFELYAPDIFQTAICVVSFTFVCWFDPKLYWSIGRTNCWYYSTNEPLWDQQISPINWYVLFSGKNQNIVHVYMYISNDHFCIITACVNTFVE